jgi:excisionase family DNA binding protein
MTSVFVATRHPVPARQAASVVEVFKQTSVETIGAPVGEPPTTITPLLTTEEAAEYLQISIRTVKNLLGDGQVPYIKIGRATRIHRDDLDTFIARNRRRQRQRLRPH